MKFPAVLCLFLFFLCSQAFVSAQTPAPSQTQTTFPEPTNPTASVAYIIQKIDAQAGLIQELMRGQDELRSQIDRKLEGYFTKTLMVLAAVLVMFYCLILIIQRFLAKWGENRYKSKMERYQENLLENQLIILKSQKEALQTLADIEARLQGLKSEVVAFEKQKEREKRPPLWDRIMGRLFRKAPESA